MTVDIGNNKIAQNWKFLQRIVVVSSFFVCGVAIVCLSPFVPDIIKWQFKRLRPQDYTVPIEARLVGNLCNILKLKTEAVLCQKKNVYVYEFYPEFLSQYKRGTLREKIDSEIGAFKVNCDLPARGAVEEGVFQTCEYDFVGDYVFPLTIVYWLGYSEESDQPTTVSSVCGYDIKIRNQACNWP